MDINIFIGMLPDVTGRSGGLEYLLATLIVGG